MYFTELRFLAFFLIVYAVVWSLPKNSWRKPWLLVASYAFYAGWDWRFLSLIVISTLVDFIVGLRLEREDKASTRKLWLAVSLVSNLGILGVFKYYNFFVDSAVELASQVGWSLSSTTRDIVLPVGISFYTFQTLSYTLDIYKRRLKPIHNLGDFALFVAFFPQLVAGPIVRAASFLPQLKEKRVFWSIPFRTYLILFLFGFVKKAVVADNFATIVDEVFADPAAYGVAGHWLGLGMYSVQIYCDFSGYSDMAIAIAGLLGYHLVENFHFPYVARSITEFWRRWHISLSTWFRDYVYISLGGNRGSAIRTYFNLVLVFFTCGLWHGASWNFVAWGLFHGFFLVFERVLGWGDKRSLLSWGYTVLIASLAWVFFRSPDLTSSLAFFDGLFGLEVTDTPRDLAAIWWVALAGFALIHVWMSRDRISAKLQALSTPAFSIAWGAAAALAVLWSSSEHQPFIYFQF